MKVNKLGKAVLESGLRFKEFLRFHSIGCKYDTFYCWCTTAQKTPQEANMVYIDRIASALNTTRIDVLNMISDKSTYDIEFHRDPKKITKVDKVKEDDNLFKRVRKQKGLTVAQLAEMLGIDNNQIIYDIENGKRADFPATEITKKYIELLDISFTQFKSTVKELRDKVKSSNGAKEEEKPYENPYVSIFKKMNEQPTDGCIENPDREIIEVDIPEESHTPFQDACKVLYDLPKTPAKAVLSEITINKVMSLIYGQVDYITYKQVEDTLKGVNE